MDRVQLCFNSQKKDHLIGFVLYTILVASKTTGVNVSVSGSCCDPVQHSQLVQGLTLSEHLKELN